MKFTEADEPWWVVPVRTLGAVPSDAVGVLAYVALADAVILTGSLSPPFRAVLALPLVFFLPGFGVLWSLYPDEPARGDGRAFRTTFGTGTGEEGIRFDPTGGGPPSTTERAVLSLGVSLAVVPIVGVALGLVGVALSTAAVVASLTAVVGVGVVVGAFRRRRVPESSRFSIGLRAAIDRIWRYLGAAPTTETVLATVLVASAVLAGTAIGVGVLGSDSNEQFTELALLTESDSGTLVEGGYPTEFTVGQSRELVVAVDNHEGDRTQYTVVATLQRVRTDGGTVEVLERRELDRLSGTVADGERWTTTHSATPTMAGENLRLVYLLYRGDAPESPTVDGAYRHAYLWVNVSQGGSS